MCNLTGRLQNVAPIAQRFAMSERADLVNGDMILATGDVVQVALKIFRGLPRNSAAQDNLRKGIERHRENWYSLSHTNLVPFHGVSYDVPYPAAIVLPYYPHGNALDYVKNKPEADILHLLRGAANGLNYLHTQSLIHGNLRASNVLIDDAENARLVDFGLAEILTPLAFTTIHIVGNTRWLAPEMSQPDFSDEDYTVPEMNEKTDVYSFSMLGVEVVTQEHPFNHRKYDTTVLTAVLRGERPRKPAGSNVAEVLWPVFEKCWVNEPTERPLMPTVCAELEGLAA